MTDQSVLSDHHAGDAGFEVVINDSAHRFRDPIITGQQILEAVRLFPADEYLVFQHLADGQLEEIRLDESVNLRLTIRRRQRRVDA